ncbi:3-isopropylmalate dehydrogenase [Actinidia chinensis var. chinensis]|uniref:3-isopropylmalate dehydrogenase n=1 Tax=Actinidia chinensis var. chinensis TaxID=1590841 RepID=A0A2R6PKJ8_ACTCC|nr:3-isopropylmalate dehydrogenase [Actinidia chinensis var. chinensis]
MASQIVRRVLRARASEICAAQSAINPSSARVFSCFDRSLSSAAASDSDLIRATLFPGDGIGPEIAESVKQVRSRYYTRAYIYQNTYSV